MHRLLFPNSFLVTHEEFEVEVVPERCRQYPELLNSIQEQVLQVATRARGWHDPETLEHMSSHFKLGPLYEANSLVLIRQEGVLVGLAGSVNDWLSEQGSIVHLCSLGLLPQAQKRGFLPVLLTLVWALSLHNEQTRKDFIQGRVFISAITQSPYLYAMLHRLFELYPSPERAAIPENVRQIARMVVKRFDDHLALEDEKLVLRKECNFFYRRTPYSSDRELNAFCDGMLDYKNGDVFVLVGRVIPEKIERYIEFVAGSHQELFTRFHDVFRAHGYESQLFEKSKGAVIHA